jgi:trans-aconitate methyltransferase
MIQRAQAETPLASFQVADITNLNLAERFDRILVKHVLHLTPKPIVALQHIIHHAQPNAIIVISVHSLKNQPKYTRWLDWFKQQTGLDYIPPSKKLSIENDEALFTSLGYNLSFTEVNERIHLTNPEPYLDYINSQKRWSRELTEAEKHLLLRYVRQEIESEIATQGYFEDWSINGVITLKLS